jgi:hypothetical protein
MTRVLACCRVFVCDLSSYNSSFNRHPLQLVMFHTQFTVDKKLTQAHSLIASMGIESVAELIFFRVNTLTIRRQKI